MSATVYAAGIWGMTAETGLYVEKLDLDFSTETNYFADEQGNDVGGVVFNEGGTFSLSGMGRTDEEVDSKLGAAIVLQNAITPEDFLDVEAPNLKTIITSRKRGLQNKGWASEDVSGDIKPFLGAKVVA